MSVEAVEPQRERDPERHREALAERAGRDLDAGGAVHVGVALELGADLAQAHQVLEREVAVVGERRVLDRRRVALAEDEAVALGPVGVLRVVAQDPVVERGDDVGGRERGVEVARLGDREHAHAVDPQHGRPALELGDRRLRRRARSAGGRLRVGHGPQVSHVREVSRRSPDVKLWRGRADGDRAHRSPAKCRVR